MEITGGDRSLEPTADAGLGECVVGGDLVKETRSTEAARVELMEDLHLGWDGAVSWRICTWGWDGAVWAGRDVSARAGSVQKVDLWRDLCGICGGICAGSVRDLCGICAGSMRDLCGVYQWDLNLETGRL